MSHNDGVIMPRHDGTTGVLMPRHSTHATPQHPRHQLTGTGSWSLPVGEEDTKSRLAHGQPGELPQLNAHAHLLLEGGHQLVFPPQLLVLLRAVPEREHRIWRAAQ